MKDEKWDEIWEMKKKRRLTREGLTYHVNINKAHDVYGRNLLRSLEWMGVPFPKGRYNKVGEPTSQWSVHP